VPILYVTDIKFHYVLVPLCNGLFNEDFKLQIGRIIWTEFGVENFYVPKGIFDKFIFTINFFKYEA